MKFSVRNALRVVLAALAPALAACPSPAPPRQVSPAKVAEKALMDRHDSLMAQEDQLFALKAKIGAAHAPTAGPYLRGIAAADAAMMDWMHQYHAPDSTAPVAQRSAYFRQQQQVLARVSRQFRATMDSATLFIQQHPVAAASGAHDSSK